MAAAIHQVLGVYADRDAVGRHTLVLRDALRHRGIDAHIYADDVVGGHGDGIRPLGELEREAPLDDTVLVYQASTEARAADVVAARPEKLVVNYHNITPAHFFRAWEPTVARALGQARRQVARLATRTTLAIADSELNATELRSWGYRDIAVVPCLIDTARLGARHEDPSPYPDGAGARWLFVGRLAPNKAQHELVKALDVYRRAYDKRAVLALPGRSSSHRYETALNDFVTERQLDDAVLRPGSVADDDLGAYYRDADVFVCVSRHEGFCNTVVEAMAAGTPVVALGAAALPRTIGDAGLVLPPDATAEHVAAAVHRVVTDHRLADDLVGRGHLRHEALSVQETVARLCDELVAVTA